MSEIVDRIRQIIHHFDISEREFCREIGVSNGFLGKVKDVGSSKLTKILYRYQEIDPEWLLTGEGEMLRDFKTDVSIHSQEQSEEVDSIEVSRALFRKIDQLLHPKDKALLKELEDSYDALLNYNAALQRKVIYFYEKKEEWMAEIRKL